MSGGWKGEIRGDLNAPGIHKTKIDSTYTFGSIGGDFNQAIRWGRRNPRKERYLNALGIREDELRRYANLGELSTDLLQKW